MAQVAPQDVPSTYIHITESVHVKVVIKIIVTQVSLIVKDYLFEKYIDQRDIPSQVLVVYVSA